MERVSESRRGLVIGDQSDQESAELEEGGKKAGSVSGEGTCVRKVEGVDVERGAARTRKRGIHLCTTRRAYQVRIRRGRPVVHARLFSRPVSALPLPPSLFLLRQPDRLGRGFDG